MLCFLRTLPKLEQRHLISGVFSGMIPLHTKQLQMTFEIQPCPFCGGTNFIITFGTEDREGTLTQITCEDCGCSGPWIYMNVENISEQPIEVVAQLTGWNKRV